MISESHPTYGGFRTRQLTVGDDGHSAPIVLLHGYSDSADTWRIVLHLLGVRGRRAIAVDMPGFGEADRRETGPMIDQLDIFVHGLVDSLGEDADPVLVGNSLGALMSLRAAAAPASRVAAVVAAGEPSSHISLWGRVGLWALDLPGVSFVGSRAPLPASVLTPALRKTFARFLYGTPALADPAVVGRFTSQLSDRDALSAMIHDVRGLAREVRSPNPFQVTCPVLIVHGAKDRIVPYASARTLHRSIPGSWLEVLARSGHCPQLDDPMRFTDLVLTHARIAAQTRKAKR